jgi:glycosyltransferase involved in cell wall biosynthesis
MQSAIKAGGASARVLLIAYHFPPIRGSSGIQRTLRFAQHLPKYGWEPIVLTIDPRAYPDAASSAGNEIPAGLEVHRAFGLDTARQLRVFGRYPGFLAVPDRWRTWATWAIPKAMELVRQRRIDVIWSTFPIATAQRIGLEAARRSGLPWVAEFRDPMWQGSYPPDPKVNRAFKLLEAQTVERANAVVMTTPSALDQYRKRFAALPAERFVMIENGFDEETFRRAEASAGTPERAPEPGAAPLVLLHSGLVYRSERDPTALFDALALLRGEGRLGPADLRIVLRASGNETEYAAMLRERRIEDLVSLVPGLEYLAALREMLSVDALLLMQAANCNAQIPAKLYEYVRAGRPVLALTDPVGDTARTLRRLGVGTIARLESAEEIRQALPDFLAEVRAGRAARPAIEAVRSCSRESQAGELAGLLDRVTGR